MRVLVLGGAGYVGSRLVQSLAGRGDLVIALDTFWFGDWLPEMPNLRKMTGDIRNSTALPEERFDVVIHLANIANDQGADLAPELSWETNVLGSHTVCEWAIRNEIPHLIFASSGSVYGIKSEENVTEDLPLVPITAYNKTKMVAERVFLSYSSSTKIQIVRPATVAGVSPRMRFDLTVNLLTLAAVSRGEVTVHGGAQVRPNIHIDDMVSAYLHLVDNPEIPAGIFNTGFENLTVLEIANVVSSRTGARISISDATDERSYRLDSSKLLATGFEPRKSIVDAIDEVTQLVSSSDFRDLDDWYTVKKMQALGIS